MKTNTVDELVREFSRLLPDDLQRAGEDLDKNIRAALNATFSRLDLVTREELEVQQELLARTRARLEELQSRVEQLEAAADRQKTETPAEGS